MKNNNIKIKLLLLKNHVDVPIFTNYDVIFFLFIILGIPSV